MKTRKAFLILSSLLFCLYACKKDGNTNPGSITGKWNIVVDSTSAGAGSAIAFATYTGKPGDYFDINTNGFIYIKESATVETLSYKLLSDSTITIQSFTYSVNGIPYQTCRIKSLSANSITIYLPWFFTPGGPLGRSMVLSR